MPAQRTQSTSSATNADKKEDFLRTPSFEELSLLRSVTIVLPLTLQVRKYRDSKFYPTIANKSNPFFNTGSEKMADVDFSYLSETFFFPMLNRVIFSLYVTSRPL